MKNGSEVRKRQHRFYVRVNDAEKNLIEEGASSCGLSVPQYLRLLGTENVPKTKLDRDALTSVLKAAGDLGRLGGLLKMLVTGDPKYRSSSMRANIHNIEQLISSLKRAREDIVRKVESL